MMHAYIKDMSGCEYYFADDMFINIPWFTCLHFTDSMSNGVEKSSLISADIVNKIPCAEKLYNHLVCVFKVKPRNLLSNYFTCLIHFFRKSLSSIAYFSSADHEIHGGHKRVCWLLDAGWTLQAQRFRCGCFHLLDMN